MLLVMVFHEVNYGCGLIFWRRAASQIVENISAGKWTASVVLEAYIARAAQVQEATNCLTEGTYRLSRLSELGRNDNPGLLSGGRDE